jgi:hypothetical protein
MVGREQSMVVDGEEVIEKGPRRNIYKNKTWDQGNNVR